MHDSATNNTRLVAPATGIYIIHWAIRTQTIINPSIRVRLNGATDIVSFRKGGTIAGDVNFAGVTGRSLVQNDYVELLLQFDTDPTRTVFHNPFSKFGMFSLIPW